MKKAHWEKAKDIFEQAMAIAPDARVQFLDKACSDDKVVRQEVEELLSSLENAESFMENPAVNQVAKVIIGENEKLESGRKLLHYEIIKPIGAGGMGEVYLAQDSKLKRKVALKLLPHELTDNKERLQRFEQEARAASALNHPNILTIHEIGTSDDTNFIATEFIDGVTLREKMKNESLSFQEILDIAVQVASALSAAHEVGVIHRDIKPENIMLRRDGLVKVLDFGLAKTIKTSTTTVDGEMSTQHMVKTNPGVIMGTVAYMSPEQARGQTVDARTDVWSFGVVLYEMVAGEKPFAGETMTDTLAAILTAEPKPLTDFNSETPEELQHIVIKTLQKNKDERYQSATDLLADLRELKQEFDYRTKDKASLNLSKEANEKTLVADALTTNEAKTDSLTAAQSQPQATSSAEYIVSEIKQHKRGVAVALSVLLIAAIGLSYWFFFNRSAHAAPIESIAVMPFVNDSGNADVEYLSDGMTETLIRSLSQLPNLTVKSRASVFRYKGKEVAPRQIAQELNVQAILTGRVVQRGDQLTLWLELVDARTENVIWSEQYNRQSSDLLALQSEIARDVSNKLKKLSGAEEQKIAKNYTENAEAYQLYLKGRYYWNKRTAEGMLKGIEYFNQAIKIDPQYALAYSGLADCYILRPAPFSPKERLQNAKTAVTRALEIDETLAEAHTSLGRIKSDYEWDWAGAEREYKRALELNLNYATTHQWYALYLSSVGRNDEAIREAKRAQELEPLSLSINTTLGWILFFMGNNDEALEQFHKTLEMDPNFVDALYASGRVYGAKKLYTEAIAATQKAINLDDDPKLIAELGYIYAASGKSAEAKQILIRLEQLPEGKYIPSYNVARIYSALGEKEKAIKWLERAFEEHQPEIRGQMHRGEWQDNFRSDPRFQDLLRRIGLVP